ncbi:MAG TPA: phosphoribosyltransferase family protein [Pyrinomonadaceae bacterium]|jgi:predicted phosphoribosyltransferase
MRFEDARAAGRALAERLGSRGASGDAVVLAVARGGVGVGAEVAKGLGLPLDLILLRRLLLPRGSSRPACAASVAGAGHLDEEVAAALDPGARDPALREFVAGALAELDSEARACRGVRPALDLAGKTVVLVDNGVRTGSTMLAALRALRARAPARVVAAAPVADAAALAELSAAAEEVVCLATPDPFGHVGLWYADFRRPPDAEICAMLDETLKDER